VSLNPSDLALLQAGRIPGPGRASGVRRSGLAHHKARLTDAQVYALRVRRAAGRTYKQLAEEFRCAAFTARDIVKGRTRRSAGGPIEGGR
jgi:hypothetical protein